MSQDLIKQLATEPDFYNPYPRLQGVQRDLTAAASIEDKAKKLLKLLEINSELEEIDGLTKGALVKRDEKLSPVATKIEYSAIVGAISGAISGAIFASLAAPPNALVFAIVACGFIGAMGGGMLTCMGVAVSLDAYDTYRWKIGVRYKSGLKGLSKEDKDYITQGIDLINELKQKTEVEFTQTHAALKNNNYSDVANSPLKDKLFSKLPSLYADFVRATDATGSTKMIAETDMQRITHKVVPTAPMRLIGVNPPAVKDPARLTM